MAPGASPDTFDVYPEEQISLNEQGFFNLTRKNLQLVQKGDLLFIGSLDIETTSLVRVEEIIVTDNADMIIRCVYIYNKSRSKIGQPYYIIPSQHLPETWDIFFYNQANTALLSENILKTGYIELYMTLTTTPVVDFEKRNNSIQIADSACPKRT